MSEYISIVNDETFDAEVLKADQPALVDFWAEWCGPCRALVPTLEAIAKQYAGKIKVVKMNIDDSPKTPSKYGVRGIPTLLLFKQGEVQASQVGVIGQAELAEFLNSHC